VSNMSVQSVVRSMSVCVFLAASVACSSQGSSPTGAPANGGDSGTGGSAGLTGSAGAPAGSTSGGSAGSLGAGTAGDAGSASGGVSGSAGTSSAGAGAGGASGGGGNGVAGAAGSSGNGSSGASGGAGQGGSAGEPFTLAWQDDFNTLDSSAWQLQTFTYDGNQATFSTQNASVANGVLTISLTNAPSGAAKPYLGVEMRSTKTLTYGKVSARMRFATGSGVVSGLVLFYTPYPNCDWNEIDIEHLGKSSNSSQLNAMVYLGTPAPSCTASVTPTQDPQIVDLGFNAETDFHLYDIEWTPAGVKYFADGVLMRDWTANIARLKLPQTILLTIWASNAASWAGPLNSGSAPTSADIDWIKVYSYAG
jgi:endo-1,3-1,4-beta-glycanase ExoK